MGIRVVLVGLVASLGFDLPTGAEVAGWVRSGRSWWDVQVASWDAKMPNGPLAFAPEAVAPSPTELAEAILAEQSAGVGSAAVAEAEAAVPAYEPYDVGDGLTPGFVDALNREAEGLTGFAAIDAPEPAMTGPAAPTPVASDRLAVALRLTGEAMRAWASVLRGPVVVSVHP